MNKIHELLIARECIKFAADNGLTIKSTATNFVAEDNECILNIPLEFIMMQVQNGWTIQSVLENEMSWKVQDY